MSPHGSIRVVKKWCDVRNDLILKCFINLAVLNYGDLPSLDPLGEHVDHDK
jgi:hypothetical protein